MDTDEKIADWQVRQAADAVILYVGKYLKRPLQQIPSLTSEGMGLVVVVSGREIVR